MFLAYVVVTAFYGEHMSMSLAGKLLSLADKFAAIASKYPVS